PVPPAELPTTLRAAAHSGIREIMQLAQSVPDAIRLEVGQPDYRTPAHIVEAAKRALDDGWHGYTPTAGLPSLRERLTDKLRRVNGIDVPAEQVVCGPGGAGGIAARPLAPCNPGAEGLLPAPARPDHP